MGLRPLGCPTSTALVPYKGVSLLSLALLLQLQGEVQADDSARWPEIIHFSPQVLKRVNFSNHICSLIVYFRAAAAIFEAAATAHHSYLAGHLSFQKVSRSFRVSSFFP